MINDDEDDVIFVPNSNNDYDVINLDDINEDESDVLVASFENDAIINLDDEHPEPKLNLTGTSSLQNLNPANPIEKYNSNYVNPVAALLHIFPDADPTFLIAKCVHMKIQPNVMIEEMLHLGYPRINSKLKNQSSNAPNADSIDLTAGPSTSGQNSTSFQDVTDNQSENSTTDSNQEQHVSFILELLPDADPNFIANKCKQLHGDMDRIQAFVSECFERKNYRKKIVNLVESTSKVEKVDIDEYIKAFDMKEFLSIFPDPVKYFTDEKKMGARDYKRYAIYYLKKRYCQITIVESKFILEKSEYNLTRACELWEKMTQKESKKSRVLKKILIPYKQPYIPLFQEIAFIENRKKIEEYLQNQAEEERRLFQEAKEKNELFKCSICYDSEIMIQNIRSCMDGHIFCKMCIKRGIEVDIGYGITILKCFEVKCTAEFSSGLLQELLLPNVYSKLLSRRQSEEVQAAGIEGLECCPFCEYASIPPAEDKIFKCLNPNCGKETCRLCKQPSHIPLRCHEVEKQNDIVARTYIENKMSEALFRECWQCRRRFIKEGGCNHMSCKCGASMCYICRRPNIDHKHFLNYACDAYDNLEELNRIEVKNAGQKAKLEVIKKNPNINLIFDPTEPPAPKRKKFTRNYSVKI